MKILYFAWVRQRTGVSQEEVAVPDELETVQDLIGWLCMRGENFAAAFEDLSVIRAALDQEHVALDAPLNNAHEVAFFPPVTGG